MRSENNSNRTAILILLCGVASIGVHAVLLSLPAFPVVEYSPAQEPPFVVELQEDRSAGQSSAPVPATPRQTAGSTVPAQAQPQTAPAEVPAADPADALTGEDPDAPALPQSPEQQPASAQTGTQDGQETRSAGNSADSSGNPAGTGPSQADIDRVMNAYKSALQSGIDRKKVYPRSARDRGQTGTVRLSFSLDRQGRLIGEPRIIAATPYSQLNNAAVQAIKNAAPFPPLPAEDPRQEIEFVIPIVFEIR